MSCRQGLLVTLAVVLEDEDIHGIIEYQPDSQVNEEDPHGTDLSLHTQNRGQHDEHRHVAVFHITIIVFQFTAPSSYNHCLRSSYQA